MEGHKEGPSSTGMKFYFNDGPAAQYLTTGKNDTRKLIEKQHRERAAAKFGQSSQDGTQNDGRNPQTKSMKSAFPENSMPHGSVRPQKGVEPSLGVESLGTSRHVPETFGRILERSPRSVGAFTRPFKGSFDQSGDEFHKRQRRIEGTIFIPQLHANNNGRSMALRVNRATSIDQKYTEPMASSQKIHPISASLGQREAGDNLSNGQASGDYFKRPFVHTTKSSASRTMIRSTSQSGGDSPDPLLGDSPQVQRPATPKVASTSKPSKNRTPRSQKSNTKIQVVIPLTPPPKDVTIIRARSPIASGLVEERRKRQAVLDRENLQSTVASENTTRQPDNTNTSSVMLTASSVSKINQPVNGLNASQPRNAVTSEPALPRGNEINHTVQKNPSVPDLPQTLSHKTKYATEHRFTNSGSSYPNTYLFSTAPGLQPLSNKLAGQQTGTTHHGPAQAPGKLLQNMEARSANGHVPVPAQAVQKSYGQQPLPEKRKHSVLIDLTQDQTESEPEPRPQKKSQTTSSFVNREMLNNMSRNNFAAQRRMPMPFSTMAVPMVPRSGAASHQPPRQQHQFHTPHPQPQLHSHPSGNPYFAGPAHTGPRPTSGVILPDQFRNFNGIVRPLDESAAYTGPYDPRTIASAVLTALNAHPTEPGLNSHLRNLMRYSAVDESSDLSTFRWDLVDPVVSSPNNQQIPNNQQFATIMPPGGPNNGPRKLPIHSSQSRSYPAPPGQPVSSTAVRPSPPRQVNKPGYAQAAVAIRSATGIPSRPASSQFRSQQEPPKTPFPNPAPTSYSTPTTSYSSVSSIPRVDPYRSTPSSQPAPLSRLAVETRSPVPLAGTAAFDVTPKQRGRPFKNAEATPPVQSIPKKRGRPFRDPQAAAATAAAKAARALGGVGEKRGRPFKNPQEVVDVPLRDPKFYIFMCEWSGCSAELHNLDTLRLHLFTVHGMKQHSLTCSWRDCGKVSSDNPEKMQGISYGITVKNGRNVIPNPTNEVYKFPKDYYETVKDVRGPLNAIAVPSTSEGTKVVEADISEDTIQRLEFKDRQDWENHIEEVHLVPYAWHMGDGPKGTPMAPIARTEPQKKPNPWLYDKEGNQVIDSVAGQKIEDGKATKNNEKRFRREQRGIHIALKPVSNPEGYKVYEYDDD